MTGPPNPSARPLPAGLWVRRRFVVDGFDLSEQIALWAQAPGGAFVDVRAPLGGLLPPSAFAGRARWEGTRLRWTHDIDVWPGIDDDVAEVDLRGDVLTERGTAVVDGVEVAFEEEWERQWGGPAVS